MKSAYKVSLVLIGVAIIAFGWGVYNMYYADTPKRRIMNYINENLAEIRLLDRKADQAWEATRRLGANTEAFADGLENDVIPAFEALLDAVNRNAPEDAELKKVHDLFRKAVESQIDGYDQWLEGVRKNNYNLISIGKGTRNAGWNQTLQFRESLRILAAENNVLIN